MLNLAFLAALLIIAFSAGKRLFKACGFAFDSFSEEFLFSLGLGIGVISYMIFFLGAAGILYDWVIWFLIGLMTLVSIDELRTGVISIFKHLPYISFFKRSFVSKVIILVLLGFMLCNLIGALTPSTDDDALSYHLFTPKKYLTAHRMFRILDSTQSNAPMGLEMFYTVAVSFRNDVLAKLIHFSMGGLSIIAIMLFADRYIGKGALTGILAAALFYSQPVVGMLSVRAKIDLGFTFFLLLTLIAFFNWFYRQKTEEGKWLMVSAVFLGLTASIKLTGIILYPIFFCGILSRRIVDKSIMLSRGIRKAVYYTVAGLLIVSPWYIRSFFWTGDPFYPYLSKLLSGGEAGVLHAHSSNLGQYLMLPWDMTFHIDKFLYGNARIAPYFLAFLPMVFCIKKEDKKVLSLLVISAVYITFFFFTDITTRYILPALALLSFVYAFAINRVIQAAAKKFRPVILGLIIIPLITDLTWLLKSRRIELPVVVGMQSPEAYLSRWTKGLYDVSIFANKNLPEGSRIFAPWEPRGYYIDRYFVTGNSMVGQDFEDIKTCRTLIEKVKMMGFTHILLNMDYHNQLIEMYKKGQIKIDPGGNLFHDPRMNQYLETVYFKGNVYLYEIKE